MNSFDGSENCLLKLDVNSILQHVLLEIVITNWVRLSVVRSFLSDNFSNVSSSTSITLIIRAHCFLR